MNTTQIRIAGVGLFFLMIFLTGFWLSRSGKPYHAIPFNIHKFIVLGGIVFLAMTVYKLHGGAPLNPAQMTAIVITGLCFAGMMITGGLLSIDKPMPAAISMIHKLFPYSTMLFTSATLFLLMLSRQ